MILALVTHMLKSFLHCVVFIWAVSASAVPMFWIRGGSLGVGWLCVYMYFLRLSPLCNTPGALHTSRTLGFLVEQNNRILDFDDYFGVLPTLHPCSPAERR